MQPSCFGLADLASFEENQPQPHRFACCEGEEIPSHVMRYALKPTAAHFPTYPHRIHSSSAANAKSLPDCDVEDPERELEEAVIIVVSGSIGSVDEDEERQRQTILRNKLGKKVTPKWPAHAATHALPTVATNDKPVFQHVFNAPAILRELEATQGGGGSQPSRKPNRERCTTSLPSKSKRLYCVTQACYGVCISRAGACVPCFDGTLAGGAACCGACLKWQ